MSWTAVHQFVPTLHRGDAIGDHVMWVRQQQRALGRRSEIFVDIEQDATGADTHPMDHLDRFTDGDRTLLVYHLAQASQCAPFLLNRPEPLALLFHNFTPVNLLSGWDTPAACHLLDAERQLAELAEAALLGICVSSYNADRLMAHGLWETRVAPIPVAPPDRSATSDPPDPIVLFVGRVAPNKAFHDLIAAASLLRVTQPGMQLRLVGGPTAERYSVALRQLVDALDLGDHVTFTGRVSDEQLREEYRAASVFCCLSDHEGFGVPLLEAMAHGLPVVAYDSSAVSETVGDAGILLADKTPPVVATALDRVLADTQLRDKLRAAGFDRVDRFGEAHCRDALQRALDDAWTLHQRVGAP